MGPRRLDAPGSRHLVPRAPATRATTTHHELPPAPTLPFSTRLRSDVGAQATLDEFFRLCDAGGPACAFSGNAADRFAALATRLRAHPIEIVFPDGSTFVLDYSNLIGFALGAMYDSASWPDFAAALADVE
jgi:hypothetical protein